MLNRQSATHAANPAAPRSISLAGGHQPPVVLFTNGPELFDATYRRFLLKAFRDHFRFGEIAIKLYIRRKSRGDAPPGVLELEDPALDRKNKSGRPLEEEADRPGKPRKSRETLSGRPAAREKPAGGRQESRGKKRAGAGSASKGKSRKLRGEERGAQAAGERSAKRKGNARCQRPSKQKATRSASFSHES